MVSQKLFSMMESFEIFKALVSIRLWFQTGQLNEYNERKRCRVTEFAKRGFVAVALHGGRQTKRWIAGYEERDGNHVL